MPVRLKEIAVATLLPRNRTPLSTLPDEFFFIVKSGQGTLDDGKMYWDLHEGIAILAPPNVAHRFVNTSPDKPLTMIMLRWTSQVAEPGKALVVRDTALLPYCEENVHWNNTSKCIFSNADGLFQNERMFIVMLQPRAMSAPHTHGQGTEEIWTKLTPGTAVTESIIGTNLTGNVTIDAGAGITASAPSLNISGTTLTSTFTIAASAATGPRNVSVTSGSVPSNSVPFTIYPSIPTITVGQRVTGTLSITDPVAPDWPVGYGDIYRLAVTASSAPVSIDVTSSAFDSYVYLHNSSGVILDEDDDSGGGTNARIQATLSAGTYYIQVTTSQSGLGDYTLSVAGRSEEHTSEL